MSGNNRTVLTRDLYARLTDSSVSISAVVSDQDIKEREMFPNYSRSLELTVRCDLQGLDNSVIRRVALLRSERLGSVQLHDSCRKWTGPVRRTPTVLNVIKCNFLL